MQEIIVFVFTGAALIFLCAKFLGKKGTSHCEDCSYSSNENQNDNS